MEEEITCTPTKLLIISVDGDPKKELSFSGRRQSFDWAAVQDALSFAKYTLTLLSLPSPPSDHHPLHITRNTSTVSFLSLNSSKKLAFFYGEDTKNKTYEITYNETFMNGLPSYCNLEGLPRFHLFCKLPMEIQVKILEQKYSKIYTTKKEKNNGWRILPSFLVDSVLVKKVLPFLYFAVAWWLRSRVDADEDERRADALYPAGYFSIH